MKCFWGYIYCVWQCGLRILWYYFTAGPIFFGVRFVPYALFLSCLLSSTQTHCLKSLFLKTNSHVTGKRCERSCHTGHSYLWTPPGHQFEMAHFVSQKKKKKLLGTKWCNCTVSVSCAFGLTITHSASLPSSAVVRLVRIFISRLVRCVGDQLSMTGLCGVVVNSRGAPSQQQ